MNNILVHAEPLSEKSGGTIRLRVVPKRDTPALQEVELAGLRSAAVSDEGGPAAGINITSFSWLKTLTVVRGRTEH